MKITYFDHYLQSTRHPEKRLKIDWHPILKAFCSHAPHPLRNHFKSANGETLFLFLVAERTYLFVVTRNSDIIKAVNSENLKYDDIFERLKENEHLGFASYVIIEHWYIGVGSTVYGPKSTAFVGFLDGLAKFLAPKRHLSAYVEPFGVSMTTGQARHLPYVGNVRFTVDPRASLYREIMTALGKKDPDQVESIQIILKPAPRKNMADDFKAMLSKIKDEHLTNYVVHAKSALDESAMDFYLVGSGALGDIVPTKDEAVLRRLILEKARANERLKSEVEKLKEDERYEDPSLEALMRFVEPSNWADLVVDDEEI